MRFKVPHVFTLLVYVIGVVSLLSWVVPSGTFEREDVTLANGMTRTLVVPGSFEQVPKAYGAAEAFVGGEVEGAATPVSLLGFLSAVPRGMEEAADIIFFIFVLGGVFGILQRTGVITATLHALVKAFGDRGVILAVVLMILMGIGGSTLGMGEEFIPLVPVFLLLSRELGYDRVFGLAIVNLGSMVGFAAATTNPFTVAIAQSIAEVPLGTGMMFRWIFFGAAMLLTITHLVRYALRVKADPSRSVVADLPDPPLSVTELPDFTRRHLAILVVFVLVFAGVLYGTTTAGWWMAEMGGGFVLIGLLAAAIAGLSPDQTTDAAIVGMKEMVVAALVVGFARGIVVVMEDGMILDTLVHGAALTLQGWGPMVGAEGMLLFQTVLNAFVPSGSGQAAVTMPLMAPLADLLGITRQTAVFAFQCGDGMSNMVIPTSGTLMAMLIMADVPYGRWIRFVWPLFLQLMALSAGFLAFAVLGGWS